MAAKNKKTEHSGAKNGGGYWGPRSEAKAVSKKARRKEGRVSSRALTSKETIPKIFKYKNADQTTGILIRGLEGDSWYFRIYGKNGDFKDFDIRHHDIRVKILDKSAEFIESEDGEEFYLDYSRDVLGHEAKYGPNKKT